MLKTIYYKIDKDKIAYFIFLILLLYFSIGIFPFEYYEPDALGIISGCKKMLETNSFGENYYTYNFNIQIGTYFWVLVLHKITQLDLKACSSILSATFGILFLLFSARFVSKLTKVSYPLCGIILLLFQEIYSAWYYMNAATGAAFFMIIGFNIITKTKLTPQRILLSSIFLALAAWTKLDVMIVFPVIIFIIESNKLKYKFLISSTIGIVVLIILYFLYKLSNIANLSNILMGKGGTLSFSENLRTAEGVGYSQIMRAIIGYFSLLIIYFLTFGTFKLFRERQWQLILVSFVPFILFLLIINGRFASGKHLLYYCPFFSIPIVFLYQQFSIKKVFQNTFSKTVIVLLFFQYVIGISVYFKNYPYIQQDYSSLKPYPTYLNLLSFSLTKGKVDKILLGIGGGLKLATSDEMLLSTGIMFSPIMWNNLKQSSGEDYTLLSKYINSSKDDTLYITTSQGGIYPLKNILYMNNFNVLNPDSSYLWGGDTHIYIWNRNNRYIIIEQATYPKEYEKYIDRLRTIKNKKFIHIAFWDWERWYVNTDVTYSKKINSVAYLFEN